MQKPLGADTGDGSANAVTVNRGGPAAADTAAADTAAAASSTAEAPEAADGVSVTVGHAPMSDGERADRLRQLQNLMDLMRPAVQSDGGDLVLVAADVEAGTVEVQLQGACSSCAISSATLQGGVERILKDRLPWITEVSGGVTEDVDYYESAALGQGGYVPRF
jgi:Fe-S cluster biogenesis protein NfuA